MILTGRREIGEMKGHSAMRRNDVTVRKAALVGLLACGLSACTSGARQVSSNVGQSDDLVLDTHRVGCSSGGGPSGG